MTLPSKHETALAVRRLLREGRSGALATLAAADGAPAAALVTFAADARARPLFLLSGLSDHTRNLGADARASFLVEAASAMRRPQAGPRAALNGTVRKAGGAHARARFLARHPDAALYAGFGDFAFYRMTVESVRYVGGFAAARRAAGRDVMLAAQPAGAVDAAEADILDHINTARAGTADLYANALLGRRGRGWRVSGVDVEGADLTRAGRFARLWFPAPAGSVKDVRGALMRMAQKARA